MLKHGNAPGKGPQLRLEPLLVFSSEELKLSTFYKSNGYDGNPFPNNGNKCSMC